MKQLREARAPKGKNKKSIVVYSLRSEELPHQREENSMWKVNWHNFLQMSAVELVQPKNGRMEKKKCYLL